jgi:bacterioferritin (cytochrome b1)
MLRDRLLRPVHRWIWGTAERRARKLLRFAETEAGGGRDLARAAELTRDPTLRRLLLRHALDEKRHAELFGGRGRLLLRETPLPATHGTAPARHGLDEVPVGEIPDAPLLAFLHCSEKAAAARFAIYREVLADDPATQALFTEVLRDEEFHVAYTKKQLARLAPARGGLALWRARASRLGTAYLRLAAVVAGALGALVLTVQYFVLLPPFVLLARRAARREAAGWRARPASGSALSSES